MKKTFHIQLKRTGIFVWTAWMFFASSGVSIYRLYCYCKGEFRTSIIFHPQDPCEEHNLPELTTTHTCCKKDGFSESGCKAEKHSSEGFSDHTCKSSDDCMDCRSQFVRLDTEYFPNSSEFQKNREFETAILTATLPPLYKYPGISISHFPDLPNAPPLCGRSLRVFIQSFLC